jgi:hypothetical protein
MGCVFFLYEAGKQGDAPKAQKSPQWLETKTQQKQNKSKTKAIRIRIRIKDK